jgi:hypothetical protein
LLLKYAQVNNNNYFWSFDDFIGNVSISTFLNQQQQNIFSNAMAQGYNKDNSYGYSSYSQYPTDEKKYECRIHL